MLPPSLKRGSAPAESGGQRRRKAPLWRPSPVGSTVPGALVLVPPRRMGEGPPPHRPRGTPIRRNPKTRSTPRRGRTRGRDAPPDASDRGGRERFQAGTATYRGGPEAGTWHRRSRRRHFCAPGGPGDAEAPGYSWTHPRRRLRKGPDHEGRLARRAERIGQVVPETTVLFADERLSSTTRGSPRRRAPRQRDVPFATRRR